MDTLKTLMFFTLTLTSLASCTPPKGEERYQEYSAFNFHGGGYTDKQVSPGTYDLTYDLTYDGAYPGNTYADIWPLFERRALALCPTGYTVANKQEVRPSFLSGYVYKEWPRVSGQVTCRL